MSDTINVLIEFGGGTELLTSTPTQKKHSIQLPKLVSDKTPLTSNSSSTSKDLPEPSITTPNGSSQPDSDQEGEKKRPVDVRFCVQWIKKNLIVEREELFLDGETVRPGILVLINSADWELEGELNYQLQDQDELVFISTLHGG